MTEKRLEIFSTFKCNNDCVFCVQKENRKKYKDLDIFKNKKNILKILNFYAKKGYKYINFLGGEPFIERNFFDLLKAAKKMNFITALATNGYYLANPNIARKFLPLIDELIVSIYGHNQNFITRQSKNPRLYKKLLKSLININKYFNGRLLKANCVINKYNYKYLLDIIKFIDKNKIKEVNFASMEIQNHNKKYAVKFELIKHVLQKVVEYSQKNNLIIRFSEIPFCILSDYYCMADELFATKRDIYNHKNEKENYGRIKQKIKICDNCEKNKICPGIDYKYIMIFGEKL